MEAMIRVRSAFRKANDLDMKALNFVRYAMYELALRILFDIYMIPHGIFDIQTRVMFISYCTQLPSLLEKFSRTVNQPATKEKCI